jgi:sensor histidine kinase YesM
MRTRIGKYALYFLAWTLAGLFLFSQALTQSLVTRDPTPWWGMLGAYLVGVYAIALQAPIILWLGRSLPIERRVWVRRTALHMLFSIVFVLMHVTIIAAIDTNLRLIPLLPQKLTDAYRVLLILNLHGGIIAYWILLGGQHAIRYYRKYQDREQQALRLELQSTELQRQLTGAQLSALKAQLQPHFLFNTLNAIVALVRQQRAREAEETLGFLGDLLRHVLEDVETQEVPLRRELEFLKLYLAIEQIRFQDRLRVEIDIEPALLDAAVPHLALQPIVENAIRYSVGRSSAAGKIAIRTRRVQESLEISVQDDGPGPLPEQSAEGQGIGLSNTRARLRQLYGESARLTIDQRKAGGVVATLVIPHRVAFDMDEMERA